MKTTSFIYLSTILTALALGFFLLPPSAKPAQAQDELYLDDVYTHEELSQMLAPIALYPDTLLSPMLMASTYPIEVIEAHRWMESHSHLQGEALDIALMDEDWDPSVKTLCQFPSILALMSERIGETTDLGNAFLAQEEEVLDMIQELRAAASAHGNLATTSRQQVLVERETIIIQPANPRVIHIPYYDPLTIYGSWWYPTYLPSYWGPPGRRIGRVVSYGPGIYFGLSFGTWSYFDWHRRHIFIDGHKRPRYVRDDQWVTKTGRWQHAPDHRRGVTYRKKSMARQHDQSPRSTYIPQNNRGFPDHRNREYIENNNHLRQIEKQRNYQSNRQRFNVYRKPSDRIESTNSARQGMERHRQRENKNRDTQERHWSDRGSKERAAGAIRTERAAGGTRSERAAGQVGNRQQGIDRTRSQ